jgi:hypothetical protein
VNKLTLIARGFGSMMAEAPLLPRVEPLIDKLREQGTAMPTIEPCFVAFNRLQDEYRPALKLRFFAGMCAKNEYVLPLDGETMFDEVERQILSREKP